MSSKLGRDCGVSDMKWVSPLYYVVVSLVVIFLLLACIAFPYAFILVVPISVFLFAIPSLFKSGKYRNLDLENAKQRIQETETEKEQYKERLVKTTAILNETMSVLSVCVPTMEGTTYEHYVGSRLSIEGFTEIQYTRRTGDFGGDIVCLDPNGIKTCVQCKRYQENVGVDGVQEAISERIYYQCERAIVISNMSYTPAARELAEKAGVELRGVYK